MISGRRNAIIVKATPRRKGFHLDKKSMSIPNLIFFKKKIILLVSVIFVSGYAVIFFFFNFSIILSCLIRKRLIHFVFVGRKYFF